MDFTKKQQNAINTGRETVLVSAAAGSGKTRVLAERVRRLVRDGADIRNMLVVTFTKAAAAEMRRRIAGTLYEEAEKDGRLLAQAEQVGAADISTYHSFCAKVVRENYGAAEVSPDFRILDEGEAQSLKQAALRELFDLLYEKEDEGFLLLLARHTNRADDARLAGYILHIYGVMMGKPDPYTWALQSAEMERKIYIARLKAEYGRMALEGLEDTVALMRRVCEISSGCDDAQYNADCETLAALEELEKCAKREGVQRAARDFGGLKIPPIRRGAPPDVKEYTGKLRGDVRKNLSDFLAWMPEAFEQTVEEELSHTQGDARALVKIVSQFDKIYAAKKRERNALDYEDLQHRALSVLRQAGNKYAQKYDHIFVDEYQDTNPVQEEIIEALGTGGNNLFMVGDIKQSIYKFRLAEPGIFRKKAEEYGRDGALGEVIMMNDNFRSTESVIEAVNFVMHRVMSEKLGEVTYSGGERLEKNRGGGDAKILLCGGTDATTADEEGDEYTPLPGDAAQAAMIARHAQELIEGSGGEIRYGNIAVLLRSRSGLMLELRRAFESRGIPCALAVEQGRDIPEIEVFLNLLRLIENPMRDIPLLSVLRSFLYGMNEEDFAKIRIAASDTEMPFCAAAEAYAQAGKGDTAEKLRAFFTELNGLRLRGEAEPLLDFVRAVADDYGFDAYFMSAPGGASKKEAFDELLRVMGELTTAQGNSLYMVLRELAEIKKRDGYYVSAPGAPQDENCVRIMTIHGSKGLEFPVVYIAGLNRRFNTRDANGDFLTHGGYGVTACYVDETRMVKQETVERAVVRDTILRDNRSEELRMLYVAMTRARDRLYLTGYAADLEKQEEKWAALKGRYGKASCMLDWIMAANGEGGIPVETVAASSAERGERPFDFETFREKLKGYEAAELLLIPQVERVPAKVSVSAVKRAQKGDVRSFLVPQQAEDGEITGARLGTLVHGLMEQVVKRGGAFGETAAWLLERQIITEEEYNALLKNRGMAEGFLRSGLYGRIRNSPRVLYEQPFNMRMKAEELDYHSGEDMLVQGILDLAFMEEGAWVLLDYKTDRVDDGTVSEAADGYRVQLDLYARALEKITGFAVSRRYLYFMRLGREVEV